MGGQKEPVISIIVPVYNGENFISDTLCCLRNQTLKNLEIIIVNDGSKDNTQDICERYAQQDSRIRVIYQENAGVSAARNRGIREVSGKYFGFFDADDTADDDYYEKLFLNAERNEADISSFTNIIRLTNEASGKKYLWNNEEAMKAFLLGKTIDEAVYTKIFRTEKFKTKKFIVGKKINEDKYFVFECLTNADVVYYEGYTKYHHRKVDGSASRSGFDVRQLDYLFFAQLIYENIQKKYPYLLEFAEINKLRTYVLVYILLFKAGKHKSKEYVAVRNELLDYIRNVDNRLCKCFLTSKEYQKYLVIKYIPDFMVLFLKR